MVLARPIPPTPQPCHIPYTIVTWLWTSNPSWFQGINNAQAKKRLWPVNRTLESYRCLRCNHKSLISFYSLYYSTYRIASIYTGARTCCTSFYMYNVCNLYFFVVVFFLFCLRSILSFRMRMVWSALRTKRIKKKFQIERQDLVSYLLLYYIIGQLCAYKFARRLFMYGIRLVCWRTKSRMSCLLFMLPFRVAGGHVCVLVCVPGLVLGARLPSM